MSFFELLYELHHRAEEILHFIFSRDYSALGKKILGVSILDIVALVLAAMILKEIIMFFIKLVGKLLDALFGTLSHNILAYMTTYALITGRSVLLRAKASAVYLITRPVVIEKKDFIIQQVLQVYYQLKERYF